MKPKVEFAEYDKYSHLTESCAEDVLEDMSWDELNELDSKRWVEIEFDTTTGRDWEPHCVTEKLRKHNVKNWDEYFAYRTTMARINGELTCDI